MAVELTPWGARKTAVLKPPSHAKAPDRRERCADRSTNGTRKIGGDMGAKGR